jgi:hypothetical protein
MGLRRVIQTGNQLHEMVSYDKFHVYSFLQINTQGKLFSSSLHHVIRQGKRFFFSGDGDVDKRGEHLRVNLLSGLCASN